MATMGYGYGSEFHLMRLMGRHRDRFSKIVNRGIGGQSIEWLDFKLTGQYKSIRPGSSGPELPDQEHVGLEFLRSEDVQKAWGKFWPQSGNQQNWDSLGWTKIRSRKSLVLVEAKANLGEIKSNCSAKPKTSRGDINKNFTTIIRAFRETQAWLGVKGKTPEQWMKGYYQYANRLAVLHFLTKYGINARLLFLYMCNDQNPDAECPSSKAQWIPALEKQNEALGIGQLDKKALGIHEVFIDVVGVELLR